MAAHVGDRETFAPLGAPRLGIPALVGQALAMGPVASLFFNGFLIALYSGASAPLTVVVALIGTLCVAWAISQYASRYAGAGSLYEYAAHAFGRPLGILSAGAYLLNGLAVIGLLVLVISLLAQGLLLEHLSLEAPWWVPGVAATATAATLQYLGVRLSVGLQLSVTALAAIPLIVVGVAIVMTGGAEGNTMDVFDPRGADASGVFRGLLLALGLFAGFETAASLGEETEHPSRAIPRAMLLTIGIVGVFYVFGMYAATIGFGPTSMSDWADPLTLTTLGERYVGPTWSTLLSLSLVVDLFVILIAFGNAHARLTFALARDRLIPGGLARRSGRQTPSGGIAFVNAAALGILFLAGSLGDPTHLVELLSVAAGLLFAPISLCLILGALRFLKTHRHRFLQTAVIGIGASMPILAFYGTLVPFPSGYARLGIFVALGEAVLLVAWLLLLLRTRSRDVSAAAAYAPAVAQR